MGDGLMVMCACTCFESKAAPLGFSLGVWSVWFIIKMGINYKEVSKHVIGYEKKNGITYR